MVAPRILLIVGGGIAAYKACELVRLIRRAGMSVRCVLTAGAEQFVRPMTFAALSEQPVHTALWDLKDEAEMGHIQLSRQAELIVVCPATADLMAKMAAGLADDLATTLLLATDKPVLVAPAMNVRMWQHAATLRNVASLRADGVTVMEPDEGPMACGEHGPGRLPEPEAILTAIGDLLNPPPPGGGGARSVTEGEDGGQLGSVSDPDVPYPPPPSPSAPPPPGGGGSENAGPLAGRHILVTAGPTHEPIDPVRYLANRSSGRQGFAIAAAAAAAGARVTLVAGPVTLPTPPGVNRIDVETARQMAAAVKTALPADAAVMVAAVADWRADPMPTKLKKRGDGTPPALTLTENPDILAALAIDPRRPRLLIGFAAETDDLLANAQAKLARKGCDWIVANDVSGNVMGGGENRVHLVTAAGIEDWPLLAKEAVAERLVARIAETLRRP